MSKPLRYRELTPDRFPDWLRALRNQSGVYVIRDRQTARVLYVGESHANQLYDTLTRHFQRWRDPRRPRATYRRNAVEIAVRTMPSPAAPEHQNKLIRRMQPRDNDFVPAPDPF